MVCLGNICRSPLAEGILKSKLPHDHFKVDSAGTAAYHIGNPPDKRSIAVAAQNGIDISHQKARKFSQDDFDHFDKIFVMDHSNLDNIMQMALAISTTSGFDGIVQRSDQVLFFFEWV